MTLYDFDEQIRAEGFVTIAGVDEAGRGAWAGPLVAAAVILPAGFDDVRINDSKQLSELAREELYAIVVAHAIAWEAAIISPREIDAHGVGRANTKAMIDSVVALVHKPDLVLLDGRAFATPFVSRGVIDGDALSLSVAAASIIAKVTRDRLMRELDTTLPQYGFAQHKGYGTKTHHDALRTHGVTAEHRASYAPIRALLDRA